VIALVVVRIHSTKHNFTTFSFTGMSVEPERENRIADETLFYHAIPVILFAIRDQMRKALSTS
jgi:hypothetical protein